MTILYMYSLRVLLLYFTILGHSNLYLFLALRLHPSGLFQLWQSQVEIEHYSVVYFDCVAAFKAL